MTYQDLMKFVSDIPSNFNQNTFEMFYKYIPSLTAGEFVDFGTGLGKSVVAIAKLNPGLKITTLDTAIPYNFKDYEAHISTVLESHGVKDQVDNFLASSLEHPWDKPLIGLNIDSEHSYEITKAEIERCVPFVKVGGLIFLDDYLVERCGVKQAVDEYFDDRFENLNPGGMCQVYRRIK